MSYGRKIKYYLKENCLLPPDEDTLPFVEKFCNDFKDHIIAIILYGSCLHPSTRRQTSTHDFYIIIDSYRNVLPNFMHSFLNLILPPNVYYIQIREGDKILEAKYNTITLDDFKRETSISARDIFTLGRFGKKVGILYIKQGYEDVLIDCIYNAMFANAWFTLFRMDGVFELHQFICSLLTMSYSGEVRIERDTKVQELFEAGKDFYRFVYSNILNEISIQTHIVQKHGEHYVLNNNKVEISIRRKKIEKFIQRSRYLSILRWPKSIYTFGNYVDYLLLKVERTKGIKIELTPLERKFPLIFGWRHFFRLLRKGMIK